jgi:hypothetical protein
MGPMSTPEQNAAIEFHDSELLRVRRQDGSDGSCVLELNGYVHRSTGTPGVSPGTGWSQRVLVRFTGVRVLSGVPVLPIWLSGGTLTAKDAELDNVVPVPSSFAGPIDCELLGFGDECIVVQAESVELRFDGEPEYVDDFPGQPSENRRRRTSGGS